MKNMKEIKIEDRLFRYNKKEASLEYITYTDCDFDENDNLIEIKLKEPKVICSIGLSNDSVRNLDDLKYWAEQYNYELDCQLQFLI